MIGPIQTNKARDVVALFDVIETLDRPKLAQVLAREMARQDRRPACFVQVNTGEEPQKAGVWPARCRRLHQGLPGRSRPAGDRPDGDPAGGRGAVPALRAARQDRGAQRPRAAQHGHERRLRGRGPVRRDPRPGRQRDLRRAAAEDRRGTGSSSPRRALASYRSSLASTRPRPGSKASSGRNDQAFGGEKSLRILTQAMDRPAPRTCSPRARTS